MNTHFYDSAFESGMMKTQFCDKQIQVWPTSEALTSKVAQFWFPGLTILLWTPLR